MDADRRQVPWLWSLKYKVQKYVKIFPFASFLWIYEHNTQSKQYNLPVSRKKSWKRKISGFFSKISWMEPLTSWMPSPRGYVNLVKSITYCTKYHEINNFWIHYISTDPGCLAVFLVLILVVKVPQNRSVPQPRFWRFVLVLVSSAVYEPIQLKGII